MASVYYVKFTSKLTFLIIFTLVMGSLIAQPALSSESRAIILQEKHVALSQYLSKNQYRRPLFLESSETNDRVSSTVYAVLDSPFNIASTTLKRPNLWCEIMILHINTKYCHADADISPTTLKINIGKKTPQLLSEAFLLDFSYNVIESSSNYLAMQLYAEKGPLSTNNYRIELQAIPLIGDKTFIYLRYSYGFGIAGRLAMQTYLATLGRGKIGFTRISQDQKSNFVDGMLGAVERNTMRYYLAIEAYFASLKQPFSNQLNARLNFWFDATEEYPEQLHEIDKISYLTMKREEYQRQLTTMLVPASK